MLQNAQHPTAISEFFAIRTNSFLAFTGILIKYSINK